MSLEPSFNCLYRRSRYLRMDEDQAAGSRQNRRELFAVAAVAFALKHHEEFRAHFLREICAFEEPMVKVANRIEVQPHHHSDLAIKDTPNSSLYVIEFKVGATLEEKQNPQHEKEFFAVDGYGTLIIQEPDYRHYKRKHFIVLNDFKEFEDRERHGLTCRSRTWSDLSGGRAGSLWADLVDSLGYLGVSAFQFQRLKNMHNAQHTKEAVIMHQTLSDLASRLNFGNSSGEDINWDDDGAWYGRNIPNKRLPRFSDLHTEVQAKEGPMGWFGYQSGTGHFERAMWFYCGSETAARTTHAFILERIPHLPGKSGVKESGVWILSDEQSHLGDAEWFDAVFKALADKR